MNTKLKIETLAPKLSLEDTEARIESVLEWRPRSIAVEHERRTIVVWPPGRFSTPELTVTRNN